MMLAGMRSLWQDRVVIAVNLASLALVPTAGANVALPLGHFNSEQVTTIVSTGIRPAAPSLLGDGLFYTITESPESNQTPVANSRTSILATTWNDAPPGAVGAITSVEFFAAAYHLDMDLSVAGLTGVFVLQVGATAIEVPRIGGGRFPRFSSPPVNEPGDPVPTSGYISQSGPIATQPNGNPWTWAAVNGIVSSGVRAKWTGLPGWVDFYCDDMWIEVSGTGGGGNARRAFRCRISLGTKHQTLTQGTDRKRIPTPGPMRFDVPI
jgi:hypothetical protein